MKTLSPERSRQAHRLFEELVEAAEPERSDRLSALKDRDPELADAVSLLLEADSAAGEFLEEGPAHLAPDLLDVFPDSESVNEALRTLVRITAAMPQRVSAKTAAAPKKPKKAHS